MYCLRKIWTLIGLQAQPLYVLMSGATLQGATIMAAIMEDAVQPGKIAKGEFHFYEPRRG